MTEAEKYYWEFGGCSCHTMPPCSFCEMLTEEEGTILWNGSYTDLYAYWKKLRLEELEADPWVVMFDYDYENK